MLLRSGLLLLVLAAWPVLRVPAETMPMPQKSPVLMQTVAPQNTLPDTDQRTAAQVQTLNTPRSFPALTDRAAWEARRNRLRQQILVSCGLYPLPPKTPLKARIFDRIERDGYTIEKVYFQTYPGFYLAGNLYRPGKQTQDKRPAILIAHGHWPEGRFMDTENGSIPARAITFARQGYVAFTYDMVGYNDTRRIGHTFAKDRAHWLWGVSLLGLQTWNSLRALDFLAALPDVDTTRMAVTGESGGGTQAMLLAAIDDRLAASAPCVMVSHTMQGGCLCENAPGLRVNNSNMEIAAAFAPKPQIMVGATGDWTKTMMTVEGPSVAGVYNLEGRADNLQYVIVPAPHNINKASREAVYRFLGAKLLHDPNAALFEEPSYKRDTMADLRVFPDNAPLPSDAKNADELTQYLKTQAQAQIEKAKPRDTRSLAAFKRTFRPAWERTLNIETPVPAQIRFVPVSHAEHKGGYVQASWRFGRAGAGDSVPVTLFTRADALEKNKQKRHGELESGDKNIVTNVVVLVHPRGRAAFLTADGTPGTLISDMLAVGKTVAIPDVFLTGERANADADAARRKAMDDFAQYFTTYNRTDTQERVQDIITVCTGLRRMFDKPGKKRTITLTGMEQAGAWAMLAASAADSVAADCDQLDTTTDDALLSDALFVPGLRRMGDFRAALTLAAPHPLLLHNVGTRFAAADWVRDVYTTAGAAPKLRAAPERLNTDALADWLAAQ